LHKGIGILIAIIVIVVVICTLPFFWGVPFSSYNINKGIDLSRFSAYGEFLSAIVGIVTLVLVVFAYKATREQVALSQRQIFDSTFFNYLQSHREIVGRLQAGRLEYVKAEYDAIRFQIGDTFRSLRNSTIKHVFNELLNDANDYSKSMAGRDFFDVLYNVLDLEYKKNFHTWNITPNDEDMSVISRIDSFFNKRLFFFGHYIRNFYSIIRFIHNHPILEGDDEAKRFYVSTLRDSSTIDELRLIFYYIIWWAQRDSRGKYFNDLFVHYELHFALGNTSGNKQLIQPEEDLEAFNNIKLS
jgi:hypothetical protein